MEIKQQAIIITTMCVSSAYSASSIDLASQLEAALHAFQCTLSDIIAQRYIIQYMTLVLDWFFYKAFRSQNRISESSQSQKFA
jgi:hypothetical protein